MKLLPLYESNLNDQKLQVAIRKVLKGHHLQGEVSSVWVYGLKLKWEAVVEDFSFGVNTMVIAFIAKAKTGGGDDISDDINVNNQFKGEIYEDIRNTIRKKMEQYFNISNCKYHIIVNYIFLNNELPKFK
jgi:hypothetical protein